MTRECFNETDPSQTEALGEELVLTTFLLVTSNVLSCRSPNNLSILSADSLFAFV